MVVCVSLTESFPRANNPFFSFSAHHQPPPKYVLVYESCDFPRIDMELLQCECVSQNKEENSWRVAEKCSRLFLSLWSESSFPSVGDELLGTTDRCRIFFFVHIFKAVKEFKLHSQKNELKILLKTNCVNTLSYLISVSVNRGN